MEGPVHHVVCREDYQRLDITIAIAACLTVLDILLVVVGAIDIEATIVFNGGGVGTENASADGVATGGTLIFCGQRLCLYLLACRQKCDSQENCFLHFSLVLGF